MFSHKRGYANGKAGGSTAGDSKQGADCQVKGTGKEHPEPWGHPPGQIQQALTPGKTDGHDSQKWDAYSSD